MLVLQLSTAFSPICPPPPPCGQVGTATSTTTPWADSSGTPSCTRSAPAPAKSADSSSAGPLTPCTNEKQEEWRRLVCSGWTQLLTHAPYSVGTVAAVKMISHACDHMVRFIGLQCLFVTRVGNHVHRDVWHCHWNDLSNANCKVPVSLRGSTSSNTPPLSLRL